jgi:putative endonuclease
VKQFSTYILTNSTRTVLYIGVTGDIHARIAQHRAAQGSVFTGRYRVRHLVYVEHFQQARQAIRREKELKGWRRARKNALISLTNPEWQDLFAKP